jgi:branched-chain amino acid transport system permease protein
MSARGWAALIAAFAILALVPFFVRSNYLLDVAIMVLFSAYLGQSWNIAGGYAGQFSFGHVVFFGTGAYASTILQMSFGISPWIGIFVAVVAGALVGLLIGYLSFRAGLRGSYFALITLAFAEVFRILSNSVEFTGGGLGRFIPLKPGVATFQFVDKAGFYWVILVLTAISIAIALWLERSRFGARLLAIRENEDAAMALGIDTFRLKIQALMLSGGLCGAGGTFYAQKFLYIDPSIAYGVDKSVEMLLVTMIGGAGTVFGPLIGAGVLHGINEVTRHFIEKPGLSLIVYGVLLVLIAGLLPDGLTGLFRRKRAPAAG